MMDRIILSAEAWVRKDPERPIPDLIAIPASFPDVICGIACRAARETAAKLIVVFTLSGATARLLSHYRPSVPIIAFRPNQIIRRTLTLRWGMVPRMLTAVQE